MINLRKTCVKHVIFTSFSSPLFGIGNGYIALVRYVQDSS